MAIEGSQSPQIGSMFLTKELRKRAKELAWSRNPLKSGQCFLPDMNRFGILIRLRGSRNPLKSGQCFLLLEFPVSNNTLELACGRNPLKSGQCFLQHPSFFTHYRKLNTPCLLYTSPSPRDRTRSRMPSSA